MPTGQPWPRITIVTPSYNQGRFLEETIRSVLLQGYPNLEYLIIDGGSTDQSVDIVRKYEPWLDHWVSEPDRGQSHAINKGWKSASGELLAWLNSDDYYLPGTLARVAELHRDHLEAAFIHGITHYVDADSIPTGRAYGSAFDLESFLRTGTNTVAQQSTFIAKWALDDGGLLDESLHMQMDQELWMRLAAHYPNHFEPEVWSHFRAWENAKTITQRALPEDVLVVRKLLRENPDLSYSRAFKRTALAAAYGEEARKHYRVGRRARFRSAFLRSLLYDPALMGGNAQPRFYVFLLGAPIAKFLSRQKRKFAGRPIQPARDRSEADT